MIINYVKKRMRPEIVEENIKKALKAVIQQKMTEQLREKLSIISRIPRRDWVNSAYKRESRLSARLLYFS